MSDSRSGQRVAGAGATASAGIAAFTVGLDRGIRLVYLVLSGGCPIACLQAVLDPGGGRVRLLRRSAFVLVFASLAYGGVFLAAILAIGKDAPPSFAQPDFAVGLASIV